MDKGPPYPYAQTLYNSAIAVSCSPHLISTPYKWKFKFTMPENNCTNLFMEILDYVHCIRSAQKMCAVLEYYKN